MTLTEFMWYYNEDPRLNVEDVLICIESDTAPTGLLNYMKFLCSILDLSTTDKSITNC